MQRTRTITIDASDVCMLTVAIEERLKTWIRTREYWELVENAGEWEVFVDGEIEESNSLYEAQKMVELWESFQKCVNSQLERA